MKLKLLLTSALIGFYGVTIVASEQEFYQAFLQNLQNCKWEPSRNYSVFTQYDKEYYLSRKEPFLHKYRCFYAIAQTIKPKKIIELGTHAGAGADAYLAGVGYKAQYVGYDIFGENRRHDNNQVWQPDVIAKRLFQERDFSNYKLVKVDLRALTSLNEKSDFVVVDAAHDLFNEYEDLKLALTADPKYIFVDDAQGHECKLAIERFLKDIKHKIDFTVNINYLGGGLVIKLK